ncbi:MAG: peptide deformylase [Acidiferrobacterales bacterium]
MPARPVLKMGDPLLFSEAEQVTDFNTSGLDRLIEDMFDTMNAESGAGLAAPQIGVSQRVVIFGLEANPRYPDVEEVPMTVLINPIIEPMSEEIEQGWEGCLSVPGLRGLVPRYTSIRYRGMNQEGESIECLASDFHARVVQHECDHLNGILYPMRIQDMRNFGYEAVLFPDL